MKIPFEKWQSLSKYFGENADDFFVIISKKDDSDYLDRSNFDYTLSLFRKKKINFVNASFKHNKKRIDVILIHKDEESDLKFAIDNVYEPLQKRTYIDLDLTTEYLVDEAS